MKKKICLAALILIAVLGIFGETVNSKSGYFKLKWGSTIEDAKKAGYKIEKLDAGIENTLKKQFTEDVELYFATGKNKNITGIFFAYYMDKLCWVCETGKFDGNIKKLEARYGNFKENGIFELDTNQYIDATFGADGFATNMSIIIVIGNEDVSVAIFDWSIYKNISVIGRNWSGQTEESIVDQMSDLAGKLLQDGKNGANPSYAFLALSTDDKNSAVENYVTDALTEAVFNTGKIKIFERANLEKILTEQKFQSGGLVNENTAKEIGNIAGVDYVCYGTLKDLGDQITINARVVDVETGEICAMSRDTIDKDDYLKKNVSVASGSGTKTAAKTSSTNTAKKQVNTLWTVRKSRNEFDGYTTYTFTLKGPQNGAWIFFGYDKNDVASKSIVRSGFHWWGADYDTDGTYEIKTDDGNKVSKSFDSARWSYDTGWKDGDELFYFSYNKGESARFMMDLIGNNTYLTVRHKGAVQRFQPAGFWDYLESQGITREEIENAIANEEF